MKLKTVKTDTVTNNFYDSQTGEILSSNTETKMHRVILDDKETFVLTYMSILGLLDELDKTGIKVLAHCSMLSTPNTNMVALTLPYLKQIAEKTGLEVQTIRNTVAKLTKQNALISMGSATYRINPRYYWKGSTAERRKTMEYVLRVECPGC